MFRVSGFRIRVPGSLFLFSGFGSRVSVACTCPGIGICEKSVTSPVKNAGIGVSEQGLQDPSLVSCVSGCGCRVNGAGFGNRLMYTPGLKSAGSRFQ